MIEYHTLKLESKNDHRTNNATQSLASLLSDYYKIDNIIFMEFIKTHIKNTTNPVKFLKEIENYK